MDLEIATHAVAVSPVASVTATIRISKAVFATDSNGTGSARHQPALVACAIRRHGFMKHFVYQATRLAAVVAFATACSGGQISDGGTGPVIPTDTTKPPGTVQRATLTVRVSVDAADATVANSAGVSVIGTTVHLTRAIAGFTPQSTTVEAGGTVRFENLLDGVYTISADRPLSTTEIARLSPADRDVTLFAGGTDVAVSPPTNVTKEVALVGNRRGSLVISELFPFNAVTTTGTAYGLGTYIEVYNNSDTTAYLDGMLLFRTPLQAHKDLSPEFPCSGSPQALRLDSTILIGTVVHAFPGTGQDYPILPGQAKVIAMDAMDHRPAGGADQLDLSEADFEQIGTEADIDNPFVPNMVRVLAGGGAFGRGYPFLNTPLMWVLMDSRARNEGRAFAYPNTSGDGANPTSVTIEYPSRYRLDILGVQSVPISEATPQCSPWTSPAFDNAPAALVNSFVRIAISRKTLGRTTDGREILQRTRTSARDFEYHQPLLRSLRK